MLQLHSAPAHRVMGQTANHLYLRPHPALAACVAHYTFTFPATGPAPAGPATLTLLPDASGCMLFTLGEVCHSGLIWGATTRAVVVNKDFDEVPERFFIEFLPGGAHRLTGLAMQPLADARLPLADVLPRFAADIEAALGGEWDIGVLAARVDALLLCRLGKHEELGNAAAMLPLLGRGEAPTVRGLAAQTGYSERHLNRLFNQSLGVSVKGCARVLRINRVLAMLNARARLGRVPQLGSSPSLAALAAETGYYDQAHLNHDFKAVCGVSPTEYLAGMAGFYNEGHKF